MISAPLGSADYLLFGASVLVSVAIGMYFANKNHTAEDYMLGGRNQRLLPVALSMMTSFVSGITLIGAPAEMYHHGAGYSTIALVALLWVPFSAFVLLPVFYQSGSVSVTSYLERRYHSRIKSLVSVVFMAQMLLYNATVLYVPSLSLQSVFGLSNLVSIWAVGGSALLYSTFGGIKAVIWTDFFQAILMYLSLAAIIAVGLAEAGGLTSLLESAAAGGRLSLDSYFRLDLTTRHTIYSVTSGELLLFLFMNGANQVQVQRALSLASLRQAQWSQLLTGLFTGLVVLLGGLVGLILYDVYKYCDPFADGQIGKRDAILIHYVNTHLAVLPGLRGTFIAGIFAATLSTLSSFQNSMAALLLEDFVKPNLAEPPSARLEGRLARGASLAFGLVCIGLTFLVGRLSGLLQAALTLFGAFGGPFLAAFYMGMLTRTTNAPGIFLGMLAGFALGTYVQMYQIFWLPALEPSLPLSVSGCIGGGSLTFKNSTSFEFIRPAGQPAELHNLGDISYMWLPVLSFGATCAVAYAVSLLTGGWSQELDESHLVGWLRERPREFRPTQAHNFGPPNGDLKQGADEPLAGKWRESAFS